MKTIIDSVVDQKILDAFQIVELIRHRGSTPEIKSLCLYCDTEQTKPYSSFYAYYVGDRRRIPCSNSVCNEYRKSGMDTSFKEYQELYNHGCRACGDTVAVPGQLCKRCRVTVNRIGGELAFADYIAQVLDHTKNFSYQWETRSEQT